MLLLAMLAISYNKEIKVKEITDVNCIKLLNYIKLSNLSSMHQHSTADLIWHPYTNTCKNRMWANAQHDGSHAEYRWRPLFNATKSG